MAKTKLKQLPDAETVKIPPSPRILKVLAEIDFMPWQCLAELIDNALDEFQDATASSEPAGSAVSVKLPTDAAGEIVVADDGRGIPLDRIRDAVSAGYSSNDPFSKLGLFGMGFNVATARLGDLTTFLSTRAGDDDWVGVQIDLQTIGSDFEVPVIRRAKDDPEEHGTHVKISRLNNAGLHFIRAANRSRVRAQLGGIYSYLVEARGYQLSVDGIAVKPWRHCVWSAERNVSYGKKTVPAIIEIESELTPVAACRVCGTWQDELDIHVCKECGSDDLVERERRVHGWLGIARELSTKEFGIDFLRNGRKILRFDKSLFQWSDPDDPSGASQVEYPIELPANQGRIVGEIHLDHVPVLYTKDGFDTGHRSWHHAVKVIRGETALRPKSRATDFRENDSPLAELFSAYRRNDPGFRSLVVGDGKVRRDTTAWVEKFHDGDAAYQTDEKWWDGVLTHEIAKKEAEDQREREREERGREERDEDDDPTREFSGPKDDELEAVAVIGSHVVTEDGERTPVLLYPRPKGAFVALVDVEHPLFRDFDDDPADLVLSALAQQMLVRRGSTAPIAAVIAELKDRYLPNKAIEPSRLQPSANQLLADIQRRMVGCVVDDPERPWKRALATHEKEQTAERIATVLGTDDAEKVIAQAAYLPIMPTSAVPRVVAEWPQAFLDGRLFRGPYAKLDAGPAQQVLGKLIGLLNDAAWIAGSPIGASREELARARLSLEILPDELIAE
jgi:Histidine kinase-, DNA gyrase B-, and HSP90-like ATPase